MNTALGLVIVSIGSGLVYGAVTNSGPLDTLRQLVAATVPEPTNAKKVKTLDGAGIGKGQVGTSRNG